MIAASVAVRSSLSTPSFCVTLPPVAGASSAGAQPVPSAMARSEVERRLIQGGRMRGSSASQVPRGLRDRPRAIAHTCAPFLTQSFRENAGEIAHVVARRSTLGRGSADVFVVERLAKAAERFDAFAVVVGDLLERDA